MIRTPEDRLVVLDWTRFTLTDFRLDLAWTLVLSESFDGPACRDRRLRGYEMAVGTPVPEIESFEVFACLRRLADLAVQLAPAGEPRGLRSEGVAALRRMTGAHRRVYEMLLARTGLRVLEAERLIEDLRT